MAPDMRALCDDLASETAALADLLASIADEDWMRPTPAPGWTVADQVVHLAYFDEMAVLAVVDREELDRRRAGLPEDSSVTDWVAQQHRGRAPADLLAWFERSRAALETTYRVVDPSLRVTWFGPTTSAASALTARIMESWAHGRDIADAVGRPLALTPALRQVAHLCVRTLPNSFRAHGRPVPEAPVRVELVSPDGDLWAWGPEDAADRVTGPALDLCLVATRRGHPDDTKLVATGPVATEWLAIAQAYAGAPGAGRAPRN